MVVVSHRTTCRFFADWKKRPQNLELDYRTIRIVRKSNREFSEDTVKLPGAYLGTSKKEVKGRLEKLWRLKQLLTGKWSNHRQERVQSETELRLCAALRLINVIESCHVPPERIPDQLQKMKA